jgi:predicted ATPase
LRLGGASGYALEPTLEVIAVAEGFNPEGGSRHFAFKTRDSHSSLRTQHYRVTCAFMNRREQMLRDLLSEATGD